MQSVPSQLSPADYSDVPDLLSGRLGGWIRAFLSFQHPYFPQHPPLDASRDLQGQKLMFAWGLVPVKCLGSDFKTIEIQYDDTTSIVDLAEVLVPCGANSAVRVLV